MTCKITPIAGGVVVTCTRGTPRRAPCACGEPHEVLCDFPLTGVKAGKTCDKKLCRRCAVHVGDDRDLCAPHAKIEHAQTSVALEKP